MVRDSLKTSVNDALRFGLINPKRISVYLFTSLMKHFSHFDP